MTRLRRTGRAALLLIVLLAAGCGESPALQVGDARVRAVIPGQDKTVGYFTVRNTTSTDLVLTGVSSDRIRAVEMHVTVRDGDMARMRRLPEVVIPAGETVRFEPGGRHLMLFGVPELDAAVPLVLHTGDGARYPVDFETVPVGES